MATPARLRQAAALRAAGVDRAGLAARLGVSWQEAGRLCAALAPPIAPEVAPEVAEAIAICRRFGDQVVAIAPGEWDLNGRASIGAAGLVARAARKTRLAAAE